MKLLKKPVFRNIKLKKPIGKQDQYLCATKVLIHLLSLIIITLKKIIFQFKKTNFREII